MVNRVPIPQFTVPVLDRTWVLLPRYLEKCILPGVLFFLNTRKQVPVPFPGASPEDVESLITNKAEQELQTIKNLKKIKSTSSESVAVLTLEFTSDFDISDARTKVREKMDQIKPDFPSDAEDYQITEINLSEQPLMILNIAGDMGLLGLTDLADEVKKEIEGIPGILEVRRAGGLEKEIRVYVNPEKLNYYNLDLNQVSTSIRSENTNLPGGSVTMGPTKYLIRVPGEFSNPEGINEALISAPNQVPVRVKDLAKVVFGFKEISRILKCQLQPYWTRTPLA